MKQNSFFLVFFISIIMVSKAIAFEFEISGHYLTEHFSHSNSTLNIHNSNNSYTSMEFMLKPIFKINDNIKITTQFTALQNHVWGTHAQPIFQKDNPMLPDISSENNIDWKAAYVTLKTRIGGFIIGRYIDSKWGTGLGDSTAGHGNNSMHKDRIMWVVPIGNYISGLVWQKNSENDKGSLVSDSDFDKYYAFSVYKKENWHAGFLIANYSHKNYVTQKSLRDFQKGYKQFQNKLHTYKVASATFGGHYSSSLELEKKGILNVFQDLQNKFERKNDYRKSEKLPKYTSITEWELEEEGKQIDKATHGLVSIEDLYNLRKKADIAQAEATYYGSKIVNGPDRSELCAWVIDPYFIGNFGPIAIEAELLYGWGKIKQSEKEKDTLDIESIAATLNLKYNAGSFKIYGGGTYVNGDTNYDDKKVSALGYLERSNDLERGFILTSDSSKIGTDFGGTNKNGIPLGNLAGGPTTISGPSGYRMFWAGAEYEISNNLIFDATYIHSRADDAPKGWSNDHGVECDISINWRIMDNLFFEGIIAHLFAGDYWSAGNFKTEIQDTTSFHGKLIVQF